MRSDRSLLIKITLSVLIVLIFLLSSCNQNDQEELQDQLPEMDQDEIENSGSNINGSAEVSESIELPEIEIDKKCDVGTVINLKKDSCYRINDDKVSLVIDHAGSEDLPGVKYYVTNVYGSLITEDVFFETIAGNSTKKIEITTGENFDKIEIRSMIFEDGTYYECLNQRFSIPSRICD